MADKSQPPPDYTVQVEPHTGAGEPPPMPHYEGQPPPYSGPIQNQPQAGQPPVVVVQDNRTVVLGSVPVNMQCPNCRELISTETKRSPSSSAWVTFAVLMICW